MKAQHLKRLINRPFLIYFGSFAIFVTLWMTSYWRICGVSAPFSTLTVMDLSIGRGVVIAGVIRYEEKRPYGFSAYSYRPHLTKTDRAMFRQMGVSFDPYGRGFSFRHGHVVPGRGYPAFWAVSVSGPVWVLLLVLASFSTRTVWRRVIRPQWRVRMNKCAACAYDLRGNQSDVCPECGTTISKDIKADVVD